VDLHRGELNENGIIIVDGQVLNLDTADSLFVNVPLDKLAEEAAANKIMSNSVAVGAVLGLLGYDLKVLEGVLRWHFAKNLQKIQDDNVKAAQAGFDFGAHHIPPHFKLSCKPVKDGRCMFLTGNESISLGVMAAGCKFVSAYPMTPTTSILEFLAEQGAQYNIAVLQPEDEIAAINNVIGAAYAGVRAMTATSGSGFALMVEGIGLSGMTETPVVVVLGERPGPAVGLPTRTEQGELLFAIRTGTGEFPRAVFAPANVEDAFWLTVKAFNLAEKYQIPVIILSDTNLANSYSDTEKFDLSGVTIERGALLSNDEAARGTDFKRYQITESGISVRAFPLQGRVLVVADSDEHGEDGHLTESAQFRTQQVAKRLRKYQGLKNEIGLPRFHEMPGARLTLIGWGSTYGAIMEASAILKSEGTANNVLHFSELWPFPSEFVSSILKNTPRSAVIENNATGQLADLIRGETGYQVSSRINKFDGRPMSAQYILDALKRGEV
jgi:2-oxoglutarate ferredoxin oxidoreductase subunit alpha